MRSAAIGVAALLVLVVFAYYLFLFHKIDTVGGNFSGNLAFSSIRVPLLYHGAHVSGAEFQYFYLITPP